MTPSSRMHLTVGHLDEACDALRMARLITHDSTTAATLKRYQSELEGIRNAVIEDFRRMSA